MCNTAAEGPSSALIGMLVMVLSFPIPGYIAKVIQNVQVTRMKKVRDHGSVLVHSSDLLTTLIRLMPVYKL